MSQRWLQIRGDPSVRRFLYDQERVDNEFDVRMDEVLQRVTVLFASHGIFHAKVHFSSGQVTLWSLDDPLRYRVHVKEEFLGPELYAGYANCLYTDLAVIPQDDIARILELFRALRHGDANIYLRSGSINVVNGCVGLNFSCDGSHYLPYQEFLRLGTEVYWTSPEIPPAGERLACK